VLQGTNLNEGTLFEPFAFDPTFTFVPGGRAEFLVDHGVLSYAQEVGLFFGLTNPTTVGTLVALYPPANFPNPDNSNSRASMRRWGRSSPIWFSPPADAAANAASPAPGAAVQPPPLTASGTQLAAEMKAYWTNFVKSGTPNGDELANWPLFAADDNDVQLLVPGPAQPHPFETFGAEHNCDVLRTLGLL
jgi:hypothetical protein